MPTGRILLVEDRESLRRMLERALTGEGYEVVAAADGEAAMARLGERTFDLVLTDLKLPAASGLEVLAASRTTHPELPVVVLTGYGTVRSAVEAMRLGAADFLEKPVEIDDLFALVASLVAGDVDEEAFAAPGAPVIVGRHPRMRAALRLLERVAPTDSTVLLTGESGTGKGRSTAPPFPRGCSRVSCSVMKREHSPALTVVGPAVSNRPAGERCCSTRSAS
jgi:DNA-binding NtrC family response regulator